MFTFLKGPSYIVNFSPETLTTAARTREFFGGWKTFPARARERELSRVSMLHRGRRRREHKNRSSLNSAHPHPTLCIPVPPPTPSIHCTHTRKWSDGRKGERREEGERGGKENRTFHFTQSDAMRKKGGGGFGMESARIKMSTVAIAALIVTDYTSICSIRRICHICLLSSLCMLLFSPTW